MRKEARSSDPVPLPAPHVRFSGEYHRRIERLALRLASLRERREGAGSAHLGGAGQEFVGYRPYRPGEDLRMLDWSLFARLDRPFVRVTRREACERWAILVDGSASMGVGPPGKLQWAAELAGALAVLGLRAGAGVELGWSDVGHARFHARRHGDFPGALAFLESRPASGSGGLAEWVRNGSLAPDVGRVILIGDLIGLDHGDLPRLFRRGRELVLIQVLAPEELHPSRSGAVEWADPEGPGRVAVQVDAERRGAYEAALHRELEAHGSFARRHGLEYHCWSSASAFEDAVGALGVVRG